MMRQMLFVSAAMLAAAAAALGQGTPGVSVNLNLQTGGHTANSQSVLELRALDKITGHSKVLFAPLNIPVKYATLTIVARSCYSTPPSETPETSAFLQIDDQRADKPVLHVFSGWMYASSPGMHGMQHPLYDVWAISCKTNAPGQGTPAVAATAPVKPVSPNAGANEGLPELPEDAGQ